MTGPVLSVRDLRVEFRTAAGLVEAVAGVSLDVGEGEIVGIVGESGSGKSATGFSILGLIEPPGCIAGGSIRFQGRELVGLPRSEFRAVRGRGIAMIFQDPSGTLNPLLTVGEQMLLALRAHERIGSRAARARAMDVLRRVGLPDPQRKFEAWPHQLSGGMRQRVAIAIAMLHRPKLIICDEPTTALDVSIQAQILAEMKALAMESGVALIWISHDLAVVSALASRIYVMYAGRIVEEGPVTDVVGAPRHPYTRGLLESLPAYATPGTELRQIPGSMPSPGALPVGCIFRPRCWRADATCETRPGRTEAGRRAWACHHPIANAAAEDVGG